MNAYALAAPARLDLMGIRDYLSQAPNSIQAKIITNLQAGFQQAADLPLSGKVEPAFTTEISGTIRSLLVRPYRIFYRSDTSPVVIVAILHGAQDIPTVLRLRSTAKSSVAN